MEQEEKVVPMESKTSNAVGQQSTETKEPETAAKNHRQPETEIVTDQCKKVYAEKEAADHVVVEAVAIRPEIGVESRSAAVDDDVAKAETETTGRPEVTASSSSSSAVDKTLSTETPDKKASTSADPKRDSAPIDPGIVAPVPQPHVTAAEPETETSKTITSGSGSKTRRSNSVDSDKEISEILRNAPPPSVLSEEEEEDGEEEEREGMDESLEISDEIGTVVIMKKTFTESVKPGQEFKPIADEFCPPPKDPSAAPPCRLEHPVPSSSTTTATTTTAGQPKNNNNNDGKVDTAAAVGCASKTEAKESEDDGGSNSILSKARDEARDLTSELRRLQDFLENLSSFTELELASFHPDDSSSTSTAVTQTQTQIDSAQPSATAHTAVVAASVGGEEDKNADIISPVDNV